MRPTDHDKRDNVEILAGMAEAIWANACPEDAGAIPEAARRAAEELADLYARANPLPVPRDGGQSSCPSTVHMLWDLALAAGIKKPFATSPGRFGFYLASTSLADIQEIPE